MLIAKDSLASRRLTVGRPSQIDSARLPWERAGFRPRIGAVDRTSRARSRRRRRGRSDERRLDLLSLGGRLPMARAISAGRAPRCTPAGTEPDPPRHRGFRRGGPREHAGETMPMAEMIRYVGLGDRSRLLQSYRASYRQVAPNELAFDNSSRLGIQYRGGLRLG